MKLLRSTRGIPIPKLYLVTERAEIGDIPHGIPYIFADASLEDYLVRTLEYEVLYQRAVSLGYPFNFKKILEEQGFTDIRDFSHNSASRDVRLSLKTDGTTGNSFEETESLEGNATLFQEFVKDSSKYVDVSILKNLKIFPTWMDDVQKAISTNIQTFATWDTNMYNKKLDGMYGGVKLTPPHKNLIIIDISGSIPRAVSSTCLALAKNMAESFYADLVITGSKSTLYDYCEIASLNINDLYEKNGMGNDQTHFKKLVTEIQRDYDTAIVFGDDHTPGYAWSNEYNSGNRTISKEDGQELCKWNINQLISFHTFDPKTADYWESKECLVAGYADWFEPNNIVHIEGWVKDLTE